MMLNMGAIIAQLVASTILSTGLRSTTATTAAEVGKAVAKKINGREDIAAVPVKPMAHSTIGWGAVVGGFATLTTFFGGYVLPPPVMEAIDTIGTGFGLPPKIAPAVVIVGSFGFIWFKRLFQKTVTPTAVAGALPSGTPTL